MWRNIIGTGNKYLQGQPNILLWRAASRERFMRVLIIPMSAMAETAGSFSRTILLTDALKEANIDTAVCFAKDVNYKPINHVKCYFLSVPMPLGLPIIIATHTFPMAQKLGITNRKSVNSFDEVLHLTGNTDYKYLKNAYDSLFKTKQKMEDRSNRDAAAIR